MKLYTSESLAQAIDYASDIASWEIDKYSEVCSKYASGKTLEDYLSEKIEGRDIEYPAINQLSQSIRILRNILTKIFILRNELRNICCLFSLAIKLLQECN